MEVSLFENQTITLSHIGRVPKVTLTDGTVVTAAYEKAAITNVSMTAELLDALKSAGLAPSARVGSKLQVTLTIGFPSSAGSGSNKGYVVARIDNHQIIISKGSGTSDGIEISLTINSLKEAYQLGAEFTAADSTHSFPIVPPEGCPKYSFQVSTDSNGQQWNRAAWMQNYNYDYLDDYDYNYDYDDYLQARWEVVCSAKLMLPTYKGPDTSVSDYLVLHRRIMSEELFCDVVVIAKNKAEVKFHRSFLAAHSSVFMSMFQSGLAEARTGIVEMPDMSEEGVRALREYLYVWKLAAPLEKSQICFELLEAGHKYDIEPLEKSMKKILLQKHHDWYAVDVALRLFLFVRGQDDQELKLKAVRVLKVKYEELKELSSYKELFKKDTDAAMDLCESLAKHFH